MPELIPELSDWVLGFAESKWSVLFLAVLSFFEAIFFPIPPDFLFIGVTILNPESSIWLGLLVAISSVLGAYVAHWLGGRLGRPLLNRFFSDDKINRVEKMFKRYGMVAILVAAITPLPYKIFAIMAGVLNLNRNTFIVASLIGRGLRYVSLGVLIYFFGESIRTFLRDHFSTITVIMGIAIIILFSSWNILRRRTRS